MLIDIKKPEESLMGLIEKANSHSISDQEIERLRLLLALFPECKRGLNPRGRAVVEGSF